MAYGFLYLGMVLSITSLWIFLAVLPKPEFINKPLEKIKDKIRGFIAKKEN